MTLGSGMSALVLALVAVQLSLTGVSHGDAGAPVEGELTVVPIVARPGAAIEVWGSVGQRVRLPVHLQRRDRGKFVTIASGSSGRGGRFTFSTRLPRRSNVTAYRAVFRRPQTGGPQLITTPVRTVLATPGTTQLVSYFNGGDPAMSADGKRIAYVSTGSVYGETWDLFVWDESTGSTRIVEDSGARVDPDISADGRFLAFVSAPVDANYYPIGPPQVFLRDLRDGTTTRVSDGVQPAQNPAVSADGRFVAFEASAATADFPRDVFVWDRSTGAAERITGDGASSNPAISGDGRFVVVVTADTPPSDPWSVGQFTVELVDRRGGTTLEVLASSRTSFEEMRPGISADGRRVAYQRGDDVHVWDRITRTTRRIADGVRSKYPTSSEPQLSATGRFITWHTRSALLPGDRFQASDVFVWDRRTGMLSRITNGAVSDSPVITADGHRIAYSSESSHLVPGGSDTDEEYPDVFIWTRPG